MSLDVIMSRSEGSKYTLVVLMISDMKVLNNPMTPMPERIGVARTWAQILCKLIGNCIEVDHSNIHRVVDEMATYIAKEIKRSRIE